MFTYVFIDPLVLKRLREKEKVTYHQLNYVQPFYGDYTCREQESTDALQMKPVWVHLVSAENLIIK